MKGPSSTCAIVRAAAILLTTAYAPAAPAAPAASAAPAAPAAPEEWVLLEFRHQSFLVMSWSQSIGKYSMPPYLSALSNAQKDLSGTPNSLKSISHRFSTLRKRRYVAQLTKTQI